MKLKNIFYSILLSLPVMLNFLKVFFLAENIELEIFGKYSLYLTYGVFISYIFNSGLNEGSLRLGSIYKFNGKSVDEISCFIFSNVFVVSALGSMTALIFTIFFYDFDNFNYMLATIFSSIAIVQFNILSVRFRIYEDFTKIAILFIIKNTIGLLIYFFLIGYIDDKSFSKLFLFETFVVFFVGVILIPVLNRSKLTIKLKSIILTIKEGFYQCYTFSVKGSFYSLDRQFASINLSGINLGIYSKALLINQVFLAGGGVIVQLLQQFFIDKSLSVGIYTSSYKIMKILIKFILCFILLGSIFFIIQEDIINSFLNYFDLEISNTSLFLLIICGILNGSNLFDSLAISSSKSYILFISTLTVIAIWFVLYQFWINYSSETFDINSQISLFTLYSTLTFLAGLYFIKKEKN